jgi:hypothetical protein
MFLVSLRGLGGGRVGLGGREKGEGFWRFGEIL